MKKHLQFILLIIALSSFTFSQADEPKRVEDNYFGIWTVHWGNDLKRNESSIDYVDTFKIELNPKGKLIISCINYEYYVFSEIKPTKSSINFLAENTEDPTERFMINYKLKRVNHDLLKGTIHNSRGQRNHITLKRFK